MELPKIIDKRGYAPDQIYNADETEHRKSSEQRKYTIKYYNIFMWRRRPASSGSLGNLRKPSTIVLVGRYNWAKTPRANSELQWVAAIENSELELESENS